MRNDIERPGEPILFVLPDDVIPHPTCRVSAGGDFVLLPAAICTVLPFPTLTSGPPHARAAKNWRFGPVVSFLFGNLGATSRGVAPSSIRVS
jgi:hypothetical protein